MNLFTKKSLSQLDAESERNPLRRSLGRVQLIALGVGSIIGTGIFVMTGTAASQNAGPALVLSMILTTIGCAFAGLCYAEFAAMIPIAGSAYTYSYATIGEFIAWIIGWDLVLEYAVGAATVGIAWSEYLNRLLGILPGHYQIPYAWCHSPFQSMGDAHGIMNVPALFIVLMLSLLLIRGMKESAFVNGIIVITKVAIVILIIVFGWHFIDAANHTPYIPPPQIITDPSGVTQHYGGFMGIVGAAGVVFFAFIGFDAV